MCGAAQLAQNLLCAPRALTDSVGRDLHQLLEEVLDEDILADLVKGINRIARSRSSSGERSKFGVPFPKHGPVTLLALIRPSPEIAATLEYPPALRRDVGPLSIHLAV